MDIKTHKDYIQEQKQLDFVVNAVIIEKENIERKILIANKNIQQNVIDYRSGISGAFLDLLADIPNRSMILAKYNALISAIKRPYFARIDFNEDHENNQTSYYIGKSGVMSSEDCKIIIVDWRAPIASLYYDGKIGRASYKAPDGKIKGNLSLKRQYVIENSRINDIVDIDITTRDEMLQRALGNQLNKRLRDIVETIQKEQNDIIRFDRRKTVVVQGVAGSGKTTIALHRVAYLLYDEEESISPDRFMIIAPNKLFLSYISNVLPELGVENIRQTTYEEFANEVIGERYTLLSAFDTFKEIMTRSSKQSENMRNALSIKGSLDFKNILEVYVKNLIENYYKRTDFVLSGDIVLSDTQVSKLFFDDYSYLPPYYRRFEIEKNLNNNLQNKLNKHIEKIESLYLEKINNAKKIGESREIIAKLIDEKEVKVKQLKKEAKLLKSKFNRIWPKKTTISYYKDFINNLYKYANDILSDIDISFISKYTLMNIKKGVIEQADLAPLVYINSIIYGNKNKKNIDNVLIDEAQDLSLFEYYTLRQFTRCSNSFTLVGDISQGIFSYKGIKCWDDLVDGVFEGEMTSLMNLVTSYRSTIEIIAFANQILKGIKNEKIVSAKPVLRNGSMPMLVSCSNNTRYYNIMLALDILREKEYQSIAVICKTFDEAEDLYNYMKERNSSDISILTDNDEKYQGGIIISPASLAKGLEFDAVIVSNLCEKDYRDNPIDIKLLYIACTRALHVLIAFYSGNLSNIITGIDRSVYNVSNSIENLVEYFNQP